jgi:hypothetical protein
VFRAVDGGWRFPMVVYWESDDARRLRDRAGDRPQLNEDGSSSFGRNEHGWVQAVVGRLLDGGHTPTFEKARFSSPVAQMPRFVESARGQLKPPVGRARDARGPRVPPGLDGVRPIQPFPQLGKRIP